MVRISCSWQMLVKILFKYKEANPLNVKKPLLPILLFMFPSRELDSTLLLNANLAQNCFAHRGALLWNNLPKEISSAKSYDSIKDKLKSNSEVTSRIRYRLIPTCITVLFHLLLIVWWSFLLTCVSWTSMRKCGRKLMKTFMILLCFQLFRRF